MSTSSAPAEIAYFTSASLTSRLVRPLGNAVATLATCTPLPFTSAAATWARSGYTQTAATIGAVGSAGSGRLALAHSARTLPGVSWPSRVVRSIIEMAMASAHCLGVVVVDRLAHGAARGPGGGPVNNGGGSEEPCVPAADPARWERALHLNLRAVMLATQLVLAPMRERGGGAIINIASTAGLGTASHDSPEYAVAKAGVVRFTACLAPLRDTMAVRANCICPGLVDTPASRRSRSRMTPDALTGLPPVMSPADIAAAAMQFLADDTLAGRIILCRHGGEPPRLLPVTDGQELA